MAKRKIVFIAGLGRSGSTLLESILAKKIPGVIAAGEVRSIWGPHFDERQLCGCGEVVSSCGFWTSVLSDGKPIAHSVREFESLFLRHGRTRHIPHYITASTDDHAERNGYSLRLNELYNRIAETTGCTTIIDSSKEVAHGFVLASLPDFDVKVIHLVRDSRAVAHSWTRPKRRPEVHWKEEHMPTYHPASTGYKWVRANLLASLLKRSSADYLMLRYEDFVSDPDGSLEAICKEFDLPRSGATAQVAAHSVSGNPIRFNDGPLTIRRDDKWINDMRGWHQALVTLVTLPVLLGLGYPIRPPRKLTQTVAPAES